MFDLCLFDLDETLLHTGDLKELREAGKGRSDPKYVKELSRAYDDREDRYIYSHSILKKIRQTFPNLRLGIFTRAPSAYACTVLDKAYPGFKWDVVIAYDDVARTKPYGDGVHLAMHKLGIEHVHRVVMVGDFDVDVRASYHAGCIAALDRTGWPRRREWGHWSALEHVPDALLDSPCELLEFLASPVPFLPELERLLDGNHKNGLAPRFDRLNHFIPRDIGGTNKAYPVYVCGRSFAGYQSLARRRDWHKLTAAIQGQKDADEFPAEWIEAVRTFIRTEFGMYLFSRTKLVISVIPHRPGRKPRLEAFLAQLEKSYKEKPVKLACEMSFAPDLLKYKKGVRSHSGELLSAVDRFTNVRDNLRVNVSSTAKGARCLIIDDVATTGASLIYAKEYLIQAGARDVTCLAFAKNVSDVHYS